MKRELVLLHRFLQEIILPKLKRLRRRVIRVRNKSSNSMCACNVYVILRLGYAAGVTSDQDTAR